MNQSTHTSVDRTVSDITPSQRHAIEELVGGDLAPDQRIFVLAYRPGVEPNEADKSESIRFSGGKLYDLSRKAPIGLTSPWTANKGQMHASILHNDGQLFSRRL